MLKLKFIEDSSLAVYTQACELPTSLTMLMPYVWVSALSTIMDQLCTILYWVSSRRKCRFTVVTGPGFFWGGEAYRSNSDVPKPNSAAGLYSITGYKTKQTHTPHNIIAVFKQYKPNET